MRSTPTLAALCVLAPVLGAQVSSPPSGDVDRDVLRSDPTPAHRASGGATPATSIAPYLVRPGAEVPEDGSRRAVTRASLDPEHEARVTFEELPGGVVLGRVPAAPAELDGSALALRVEAGRLVLESADGSALRLPEAAPSLVTGALAFASRDSAAEWLVDIEADGTVHLAPELRDTAAGQVALRADLVPGTISPALDTRKTVLVDRDVRLRVEGDALRLEADLELRAYQPNPTDDTERDAVRRRTFVFTARAATDGAPLLTGPAGEGPAAMATHLADLSGLASWVGFFRWARAAGVSGIDALPAALPHGPEPTPTPTHVSDDERLDWVLHGRAVPRGAVPDWMRRHRDAAR